MDNELILAALLLKSESRAPFTRFAPLYTAISAAWWDRSFA